MSIYSIAVDAMGVESDALPDLHNTNSDVSLDDFVISRDPSGEVRSKFSSDNWDLRSYSTSKRNANWHFLLWGKPTLNPALFEKITYEIKVVQYCRGWVFPVVRQPSSLTLTVVNKLALAAYNHGISLFDYICGTQYKKEHIERYKSINHNQQMIYSNILTELASLYDQYPLTTYDLNRTYLYQLNAEIIIHFSYRGGNRDLQKKRRQHLPIPTRIYSELISYLEKNIEEVFEISDALVDMFRERNSIVGWKKDYFGATKGKMSSGIKSEVLWEPLMDRYGLLGFIEKHNIYGWQKLKNHLCEVARRIRIWLMTFSGMRIGEVIKLPSNSYQQINVEGGQATILRGYTHKTIGGGSIVATNWVTTSIVEKAFSVAQRLSRIPCLELGFDESLVGTDYFPLFPMWNSLTARTDASVGTYPSAPLLSKKDDQYIFLREMSFSIVDQSDIDELLAINPDIDLEHHCVEVGKPWPFKNHQLRRSLALYSARSGIVSLGSLKYQFQHLTKEMTLYYQYGSLFAKDILGGSEDSASILSLIKDIDEERRFAQYLLWEDRVMDSNDILWGGEGNRIQVAKNKGAPLIITTDRNITLKKFQKGQIVAKEGPIGICTNPDPCEEIGLSIVGACPACTFSVNDSQSLQKLTTMVNRFARAKSVYPEGSLTYKQMELEELQLLKLIEKHQKPVQEAIL